MKLETILKSPPVSEMKNHNCDNDCDCYDCVDSDGGDCQ